MHWGEELHRRAAHAMQGSILPIGESRNVGLQGSCEDSYTYINEFTLRFHNSFGRCQEVSQCMARVFYMVYLARSTQAAWPQLYFWAVALSPYPCRKASVPCMQGMTAAHASRAWNIVPARLPMHGELKGIRACGHWRASCPTRAQNILERGCFAKWKTPTICSCNRIHW